MNNTEIAQQWLAAFNEHNLEKLLLLYSDNAIHFSPKLKTRQPETNGIIKGKSELRKWWQDAFSRLPTLNYRKINFIANNQLVLIEYLRTVANEEDMMVAEILEIKDEKIISSRVYHS